MTILDAFILDGFAFLVLFILGVGIVIVYKDITEGV